MKPEYITFTTARVALHKAIHSGSDSDSEVTSLIDFFDDLHGATGFLGIRYKYAVRCFSEAFTGPDRCIDDDLALEFFHLNVTDCDLSAIEALITTESLWTAFWEQLLKGLKKAIEDGGPSLTEEATVGEQCMPRRCTA